MGRGFEFHLTEITESSSAGRALEKLIKSCMQFNQLNNKNAFL